MKTSLWLGLTTLLASSSAACGSSFDPGSRVTTLRVLAVRADAPFATPGEAVALQALAFDPNDGAPPVTWAWATCINPVASTVDACFAKIAEDFARTGAPPAISMGIDQRAF